MTKEELQQDFREISEVYKRILKKPKHFKGKGGWIATNTLDNPLILKKCKEKCANLS